MRRHIGELLWAVRFDDASQPAFVEARVTAISYGGWVRLQIERCPDWYGAPGDEQNTRDAAWQPGPMMAVLEAWNQLINQTFAHNAPAKAARLRWPGLVDMTYQLGRDRARE